MENPPSADLVAQEIELHHPFTIVLSRIVVDGLSIHVGFLELALFSPQGLPSQNLYELELF